MSYLHKNRNSSDFHTETDESGDKFFISEKLGIRLKIKPNGYTPRSGLHLLDILDTMSIGQRVLDIGTGETGLIAHYLLSAGAKIVIASDIDTETIKHAKTASDKSSGITWLVSDVYDSIKDNNRFDLIVSNPPQMWI
jgi:methylase of polypeptide subunit release factors